MARDIEEFLRKAAERRAKQKAGGGNQPPRQAPAPRQEEPIIIENVEIVEAQPARRPVEGQRLTSKVEQRIKAKEQQAKAKDMRRQGVAEHVKSHIDTSRVTKRAETLGDRIASVHERVDARVHQHLDHDISKVDDKPTITDDPSPEIFGKLNMAVPNMLRQMLSDPDQVGNAIILSEILKRPDFD